MVYTNYILRKSNCVVIVKVDVYKSRVAQESQVLYRNLSVLKAYFIPSFKRGLKRLKTFFFVLECAKRPEL